MRRAAAHAHVEDMFKILLWRNDGDLSHCRMLLANGDFIAITLSAGGVRIDRLGRDGTPEDVLFRGDAEVATGICMGLLAGKPPQSTTPLDVLAGAVARMPSAAAVRGAFQDAARGLPAGRRSEAIPRAIVVALLLSAVLLAGLTGYTLIAAPSG